MATGRLLDLPGDFSNCYLYKKPPCWMWNFVLNADCVQGREAGLWKFLSSAKIPWKCVSLTLNFGGIIKIRFPQTLRAFLKENPIHRKFFSPFLSCALRNLL